MDIKTVTAGQFIDVAKTVCDENPKDQNPTKNGSCVYIGANGSACLISFILQKHFGVKRGYLAGYDGATNNSANHVLENLGAEQDVCRVAKDLQLAADTTFTWGEVFDDEVVKEIVDEWS